MGVFGSLGVNHKSRISKNQKKSTQFSKESLFGIALALKIRDYFSNPWPTFLLSALPLMYSTINKHSPHFTFGFSRNDSDGGEESSVGGLKKSYQ